jgi:Phosphotransferase enzyme family
MIDHPAQDTVMPGGRTAGAIRSGDTVVRPGGSWTPAVHAVLRHLEAVGFDGAPRVVGYDTQGREVVTYLPGRAVGDQLPWPAWIHTDAALIQVGEWLRRLHDSTATFTPPQGLTWFAGQSWQPGLIIGHHDAGPYNVVWQDDSLVGFVDWDTAGPSSRELDLAFTALSWVPLYPRHVVEPQGFTAFDDRSRRLHLLLDAYHYAGDRAALGATVARRARVNAAAIQRLAATGNPNYRAILPAVAALEQAAREIDDLPPSFWREKTSPHHVP